MTSISLFREQTDKAKTDCRRRMVRAVGPREGGKIALTPLATDAPIIVVALVLVALRSPAPPSARAILGQSI